MPYFYKENENSNVQLPKLSNENSCIYNFYANEEISLYPLLGSEAGKEYSYEHRGEEVTAEVDPESDEVGEACAYAKTLIDTGIKVHLDKNEILKFLLHFLML